MPLKDKINKISAAGLILSAAIIFSGYVFDNKISQFFSGGFGSLLVNGLKDFVGVPGIIILLFFALILIVTNIFKISIYNLFSITFNYLKIFFYFLYTSLLNIVRIFIKLIKKRKVLISILILFLI